MTQENIKEHIPNRPNIPDDPYKIWSINGGSLFRKTNSLFNLFVC